MHLHREKFLLFFFLFLVTFSPGAAAQEEKTEVVREELPSAPKIENTPPAVRAPQTFSPAIDFAAAAPARGLKEKREISVTPLKSEIEDIEETFREIRKSAAQRFDARASGDRELKNLPYKQPVLPADLRKKPDDESAPPRREGFNWRGALTQSFMFLGVQHGYALIFQKKTRQALKGKFWTDWGDSVQSLHGWSDGNRFFTNYIAHPMQGALTGFIYVQNSPQARRQEFGKSRAYWNSRLKAMLWSTAWSTQFELGPISQASIANVGLKGKQTWVDIVITPTVGSGVMIAEEALDRYLIKSIERRTENFYVRIFARMLFNPTRIFSNILRFKEPWYRDRPPAR